MKTLYLAAALLMAATSAHAGNGMSFVIDGKKIRIDAPKNCASLDCIKITGANGSNVNLKGFGSKKNDDNDRRSARPRPLRRLWPHLPRLRLHRLRAPRLLRRPLPLHPAPQPERLTATAPLPPAPPALPLPQRLRPRLSRLRLSPRRCKSRTRRSACGRPKRTRATFASSSAAPICAAMPSTAARGS